MGKRQDKEWLFTLARALQTKAAHESSTSVESALTPAPIEASPNARGRDYGLFVGILSVVISVIVFSLQSNGVEVNWIASIVIYASCATAAAWTTLRHALPGKSLLIRSSVTGLLLTVCLVSGSIGTVKQYQKEHSVSVAISPSQEENEEIAQLDNIFAGRDEIKLREFYGFPEMLALNMDINKARRMHYRATGNPNMDLEPYINGRQMAYDAQYAPRNFKNKPGALSVTLDINVVSLLVLPQSYTDNKAALLRYENSTDLPIEVIYAVKDFDRALQANEDLMLRAMNIAMREDTRLFLEHDDINSPQYFQVVESRYWTQFEQLRPLADKIRDSVRDELNKRRNRQAAEKVDIRPVTKLSNAS
jgi:hypothetical protein